MAFIAIETQYLSFGGIKINRAPVVREACDSDFVFCQLTEQGDTVAFQFLSNQSADIVKSGTFPTAASFSSSDTSADWYSSNGWMWGGPNKLIHISQQATSPLIQFGILTPNRFYRFRFTVSDINETGSTAGKGFTIVGTPINITANGEYDIFAKYTGGQTALKINPTQGGDPIISSFSIVEVAEPTAYTVNIVN